MGASGARLPHEPVDGADHPGQLGHQPLLLDRVRAPDDPREEERQQRRVGVEEQLAAHVGYSGEFAVDGPSVLAVDVERDDTANRGGAEVSLVDSDEAVARVAVVRFSRGSPGRTVYLSAVPTGRYRLRLTGFEATDETVGAGADAAQGRGAGAGVIRAQVLTGKRSGVGLGIAVALLLLPIGVGLIRRRLRRSKGTATGQP